MAKKDDNQKEEKSTAMVIPGVLLPSEEFSDYPEELQQELGEA